MLRVNKTLTELNLSENDIRRTGMCVYYFYVCMYLCMYECIYTYMCVCVMYAGVSEICSCLYEDNALHSSICGPRCRYKQTYMFCTQVSARYAHVYTETIHYAHTDVYPHTYMCMYVCTHALLHMQVSARYAPAYTRTIHCVRCD
jgi:hypothetical protein